MTITITVEDQVGDQVIRVDRSLLAIEIDYAAFDVACHTINKLREEVEAEKNRLLHPNNA